MNFPEPCPFCWDPDSHDTCTCPTFCGATSLCGHWEQQAKPDVFADNGIRAAITLLRERGVSAEQYRSVQLVERWSVDGIPGEFPDRAAAFSAAQEKADRSGEWAEVWRNYGPDTDWFAESWIVKPRGADT